MFGALIFTFLKFAGPPGCRSLTEGWTTTLNIYSQVGLVTLVGLDLEERNPDRRVRQRSAGAGMTKIEAVKEAALTRLRPILMTTVATVAGHFPLTFVSGPGAAARNSIGRTLVTGMAVGTFFTLFFVPVIYLLIARDHRAEAEAGGREVEDKGTGGGGRLTPTPAAPERSKRRRFRPWLRSPGRTRRASAALQVGVTAGRRSPPTRARGPEVRTHSLTWTTATVDG